MNNLSHPATAALATIPWTETHVIRAKAVDQDYQISVSLPAGYYTDTEARYPTIYVLDGNWYFGMVVDMVRIMNFRLPFCNELPDAIIVGIGYPEGATLSDRLYEACHRRLRDFLAENSPSDDAWHSEVFPVSTPGKSGGAANFRDFLENELIPWVESRYRAAVGQRCLVGHSFGGQCALYVLFTRSDIFQKYLIASPAGVFATTPWICDHTGGLSASVYLSNGELEMESEDSKIAWGQLAQTVKKKLNGTGSFVEQMFPKQTHCAVVAPCFQAGLVVLLGMP